MSRRTSSDLSAYLNSKPLKADPSSFVMHTQPVKLSKNDMNEIRQTKLKIKKIQSKYSGYISNPKKVAPEYILSPIQINRVNKLTRNTFLAYKIFISDINRIQANISKNSIKFLDCILALIDMNVKQSRNVKCDFNELENFFNEKYQKSKIPNIQEKINKLTKNMNFFIPKVNSLKANELHMIEKLKLELPKVQKQNDYIEMNNFDELLGIYIESKQNDERLHEIVSLIKYGKEQCIGLLIKHLNKLIKATTDEQFIILKSACIRYFYSVSYRREPEVLNSHANCLIFFKNCSYISSFSPKNLGLSPHLFTVEQMDLPLLGVVRHSEILAEMADDLNSLQFLLSPVDMIITISRVILKLEEFVKQNILNKKFGQFASMVESDFNKRRNREMMSFDDCFSLFFSILSINPPSNSIEISVCFQNSPELVESIPLKMAKATFISAVDHILGFSEEQIINDNQDFTGDPLGVL